MRHCIAGHLVLRSAAVAAASLWAAAGSALGADAQRGPNVVLIVADDLGYGELSCQGCRDVATPNIDSIARNGVRFTNAYVTCPVCAPTRAGLLTGRYQQRFGFENNPGPEEVADPQYGLPVNQPTLAERMKAAGYTTGMVGKWHLGFRSELTPPQRGFDSFFGFLGGAHSYLPGVRGGGILRGNEPVQESDYLTDAFGREAVSFIGANKDKPFLLYLPFNAVHAPLQAKEAYLKRVAGIQEEKRRTFAAMTLAMDDAVGKVLEKLREEHLEENTLVFFISDNGGPTMQTTSANGPLRGFKGQVWEGGIRIPFMMQWKGHLPAGRVYEKPVISLDISATTLAAIGRPATPADGLDGANLLPFVTAKAAGQPHDVLYWRFGGPHAIRMGDWKLVVASRSGSPELYNLANDIGETHDLAEENSDKVKELTSAWEGWNAQLQPPKWNRQEKPSGGGNGPRRPLRPGPARRGRTI